MGNRHRPGRKRDATPAPSALAASGILDQLDPRLLLDAAFGERRACRFSRISPSFEGLEPRLLLDGSGFGPTQVIGGFLNGPYRTYATDLDGDGDADVLAASNGIAWYQNPALADGKEAGSVGRDLPADTSEARITPLEMQTTGGDVGILAGPLPTGRLAPVVSVDRPTLAVAKMLIESVKGTGPDLDELEQAWLESGKAYLQLDTESPFDYLDRLVKPYGLPVYWQDDVSADAIWAGIQASMQSGLPVALITPAKQVVVSDAWLEGPDRRLQIADPAEDDLYEVTLNGQVLVELTGGNQTVEFMLCVRPVVEMATATYGTVAYTAATDSLSGLGLPTDPDVLAALKAAVPYASAQVEATLLDDTLDGGARQYTVALAPPGTSEATLRAVLSDRYSEFGVPDSYEFAALAVRSDGTVEVLDLAKRIDDLSLAYRPEMSAAISPGKISDEEAQNIDAAYDWYWLYHLFESPQAATTQALRTIVSLSPTESMVGPAGEYVHNAMIGAVKLAIEPATGKVLKWYARRVYDEAYRAVKQYGLPDSLASTAGVQANRFYQKLYQMERTYGAVSAVLKLGVSFIERAVAAALPIHYLTEAAEDLKVLLGAGVIGTENTEGLLRTAMQTVTAEIDNAIDPFWSRLSESITSGEFLAETTLTALEFAAQFVATKAAAWAVPIVGQAALAIEIGFMLGDLLTGNSAIAEAFGLAKYSKDIERVLHKVTYEGPDGLHQRVAQGAADGSAQASVLCQYKAAVHLTLLAEGAFFRKVADGLNAQTWLLAGARGLLRGEAPYEAAKQYLVHAENVQGLATLWYSPPVVSQLHDGTLDTIWGDHTPLGSELTGDELSIAAITMKNSTGAPCMVWASEEPGTIEVTVKDPLGLARSGASVEYAVIATDTGAMLPGYPRQCSESLSGAGMYTDASFVAPMNPCFTAGAYALEVTATYGDGAPAHARQEFTVSPHVPGHDVSLLGADWDRPEIDDGQVRVPLGQSLLVSFWVKNQGRHVEDDVPVRLEILDEGGSVVAHDRETISDLRPGASGYTDHNLPTTGLSAGVYTARGRVDISADDDWSNNEMAWHILLGDPPMESDQLPLQSYRLYRHDYRDTGSSTVATCGSYTITVEYLDWELGTCWVSSTSGYSGNRTVAEDGIYAFDSSNLVIWFDRLRYYSIPSPGTYHLQLDIGTYDGAFVPSQPSQFAFPYTGASVSSNMTEVPEENKGSFDFYLPVGSHADSAYLVAYGPAEDSHWLDDNTRYWSPWDGESVGIEAAHYGGSLRTSVSIVSPGAIDDYFVVVPDRNMPADEYNFLIFQRMEYDAGLETLECGWLHSVRLIVRDYHDLALTDLDVPQTLKAGDVPAIRATVKNNGSKTESDFAVQLEIISQDGNYHGLFEQTVASLGSQGTRTVTFDQWGTTHLAGDLDYTFTARVSLPTDMKSDNDTAQQVRRLLPLPLLDVNVTGLASVYDQAEDLGNPSVSVSAEGNGVSGVTVRCVVRSGQDEIAAALVTTQDGTAVLTGLTAPAVPGSYTLRVTATKSGYADGTWNGSLTVRDSLPPSVPSPVSPDDGQKLPSGNVLLDWSDSVDASSGLDRYLLQVDDDPDFANPEIDEAVVGSDWQPAALLAPGTYSWRVRAVDRAQLLPNQSDWSQPWTFVVLPTNTRPVAEDQSVSLAQGASVVITLHGSDAETPSGDLTFLLASSPQHGTLSEFDPAARTVTYTPEASYAGEDSFEFMVGDSGNPPGSPENSLCSEPATISIAVSGPPVAFDDSYSTEENQTLTVPAPGVLGNDTDPNGDVLTAVLDNGPDHGTLTLDSDGSFRYTPNADFHGIDSFTYKASDGQAPSNVATVIITLLRAVNYLAFPQQDVDVGDNPYGIVSADFNGDGRADLAVTNNNDDDVSVLYGQAGGGFGGRQDVAVGDQPHGIVPGDFNGDGRADLAVTNVGGDDVSVLYGQADGGFGGRRDVDVGIGPEGIVSADFNGDGRVDLAVTNNKDDDVSVLYGQEGGGFGGRRDVAVGHGPCAIVSGDLNGDGRVDLALANYNGDDVSVLYGQEGGGFGGRQDVAVGDRPEGIVSGDFNGDGRADLAVTNTWGDDVSVLYGQADGGFGGREDVAVGGYPVGIVSGDFNGDSRADLAITRASYVSVLYGQAGGGFGGRQDVAGTRDPHGIVSGDFNGDGRADLAVTNFGDDDVSVLYGQADGGFGGRQDVDVGDSPWGIVSGDFNGDGRADLAVANYNKDDVSVLYGHAGGSFADRQDVAVGDGPIGIVSGDFNGDGRVDLAVANYNGDGISVLYGQEGGGFGGRQDVAVADGPYAIVSGDLNGDGRVDLAVTNSNDDDVSVLYAQAGGGFGAREDVAVRDRPEGIVSGDFNGDGRADLAVTNSIDDDMSVLYGQAGGGFGARRDVAVGDCPYGIVSADFDGDGRLDLAVGNMGGSGVSVLYGQVDGGFGAREDVAVGDAPCGIVSGDFNSDGRLDLAVANNAGNDVSVLYGQPGGGFGGRQDVAVGDRPGGIVSGDFNGDGRADLAVTNSIHDDVSLLYAWAGGAILPVADAGEDQEVIDIDGDSFAGVLLDGSKSAYEDGAIARYVWRENGIELATSTEPVAHVDVPIGRHWVTLTVTDDLGVTDTDEVIVDVWPAPSAGGPAILANPVVASIQQREHPYRIMWTGDATPRLWTCGPTGLQVIADPGDLPVGQAYHDWDVAGATAGWYTFISQTEDGQSCTVSCSPSWVRVTDQGGQAMGVQTMALVPPGVEAPGATGAPEGAVLTWLSPAGGETVEWGDAFELRWEVNVPTSDGMTGSLWVSCTATEQWTLIADDLDAHSGRYVFDTTGLAPGQNRFGIRLDNGDFWADLIPSDLLEVLEAGMLVLPA